MSAVVLNRLHLSVPVDEIVPTIRALLPDTLDVIDGFEHVYLVKTAEDRVDVIIVWRDEGAANAAAAILGPTLFAKHFAPVLASPQDRTVGTTVIDHPHP
ncbi:MAG: hypothetical protein IVW53_09465 [Chloroflexi bacterium]|nr:hypothetical protein [Chloroflexota bacterium]